MRMRTFTVALDLGTHAPTGEVRRMGSSEVACETANMRSRGPRGRCNPSDARVAAWLPTVQTLQHFFAPVPIDAGTGAARGERMSSSIAFCSASIGRTSCSESGRTAYPYRG